MRDEFGKRTVKEVVSGERRLDEVMVPRNDVVVIDADLSAVLDHAAATVTGRAGLLNGEKALLHAHLAGAAAGRALGRLGTFFRAAAVTAIATDLCRDVDRDVVAADGLFSFGAHLEHP